MVAYSLMTNAGWQIMVRNVDGSGARRMSSPGLNITPTFSPDGRLLVYASGEGVGTDLYAVPVEGGTRRRLTVSQRVENVSPTFSPDGRRVAFSSNRTGRPEIWMASVDGGTPEMLTQYEFGVNNERHSPEWSPDNRRVAFYRFDETGIADYHLALDQTRIQTRLDAEPYMKTGTPNPVVEDDAFVDRFWQAAEALVATADRKETNT